MGEAAEGSERGKMLREILENDTVGKKREKQSDSERVKKRCLGSKDFNRKREQAVGAGCGSGGEEEESLGINRIKHKSLILAQDERWRRA